MNDEVKKLFRMLRREHEYSSLFLKIIPCFVFTVFGFEIIFSQVWKCKIINMKRNFRAGISTLMSFSDEIGPSIFRRKIEKTRPMREKMDGEVFINRHSWHFKLRCCLLREYFSLFVP